MYYLYEHHVLWGWGFGLIVERHPPPAVFLLLCFYSHRVMCPTHPSWGEVWGFDHVKWSICPTLELGRSQNSHPTQHFFLHMFSVKDQMAHPTAILIPW